MVQNVVAAGSLGLVLTLQLAADNVCCVVYQPNEKVPGHGIVYNVPHSYFGIPLGNDNQDSTGLWIYLIFD